MHQKSKPQTWGTAWNVCNGMTSLKSAEKTGLEHTLVDVDFLRWKRHRCTAVKTGLKRMTI